MNVGHRLGQVLSALRHLDGRKQGELARLVGYKNQSPLSKIERGRKQAYFHEVWLLRELFDVSLADIERGMRAFEEGWNEDWIEGLRRRGRAASWGDGTSRGLSSEGPGPDPERSAAPEAPGGPPGPPLSALEGGPDAGLFQEMARGLWAFLRFLQGLARR